MATLGWTNDHGAQMITANDHEMITGPAVCCTVDEHYVEFAECE